MFSSQVTGKAIIFSAPSGAGKTTLVRYLLSEPALMLAFSVSATSREKRGEEVDGLTIVALILSRIRPNFKVDMYSKITKVKQIHFMVGSK